MENNDIIFKNIKIGCFGESSVGKTYFAKNYIKDIKDGFDLATVGVEYFITNRILSDGKNYKIKICDTAGQERYRSLAINTIRRCDGIILMYSITNRNSFELISEWINNIYDLKDRETPIILIGNKCDLEDQRKVSREEGMNTAEKYKTTYFETSAKEGINVEEAIDELINKIIAQKKEEESSKDKKDEINNIKLDKSKSINKVKFKCCGK
jgi:small GTP-binding protein